MARFILIDPWLNGVGGHNHQYACDILSAAKRSGYAPILATNRRFVPGDDDLSWSLYPVFNYQASSRYWLGPDGKCRRPVGLDGHFLSHMEGHEEGRGSLWRLRDWVDRWDWYAKDRSRRIENYAADLKALFSQVGLVADDVVFLPSLSEFDFLGCVKYWRDVPESRHVRWHLQFHFDVFSGRPHEYSDQEAARLRFQRHFANALREVPHHDLRFYNTTSLMTDQYNRLQVARFEHLPYPVSDTIRPSAEPFHSGALRVTCAGVIRREKGREALSRLIKEFTTGWLDQGRIQLVIQSTRQGLRRVLPADWYRKTKVLSNPDPNCTQPIVPVAFPLSRHAYRDLIQQADIGLFVYDARRYHARASGVLGEMFAAGVPVIVPAGCWLSDQVAQPNYLYLDDLVSREDRAQVVSWTACEQTFKVAANHPVVVLRFWPQMGSDVAGERELAGKAWARKDQPEVRGPLSPSDLPLANQRIPVRTHHHFQITTEQLNRQGEPLRPARVTVLAPRLQRGPIATMVKLEAEACQLRVRIETAYASECLTLANAEAVFLPAADTARPLGAVGLIASQEEQVGELLREMVNHYRHYRETAMAFSNSWHAEHSPDQTIRRLAASAENIARRTAA